MFIESSSLYLTCSFKLSCELWQIYYMNQIDVIVLKTDVKVV